MYIWAAAVYIIRAVGTLMIRLHTASHHLQQGEGWSFTAEEPATYDVVNDVKSSWQADESSLKVNGWQQID